MCIRDRVYIDLDAGENTIKIFNPIDGQKAVSYTHLDVYKRQLSVVKGGWK